MVFLTAVDLAKANRDRNSFKTKMYHMYFYHRRRGELLLRVACVARLSLPTAPRNLGGLESEPGDARVFDRMPMSRLFRSSGKARQRVFAPR